MTVKAALSLLQSSGNKADKTAANVAFDAIYKLEEYPWVYNNKKKELIHRIRGRAEMNAETWRKSYQGVEKPFPPEPLVRKQAYETALLDIESIL